MDDAIEKLQQLLFDLTGIAPDASSPLFSTIKIVQLEANQTYIRQGDTSRKLAYITRGIIRVYTIKPNISEATLFVRQEGQFIASHESIIFRNPSHLIYQALEPVFLLEIDYDMLEEVMKNQPEYEPLRNFFLMRMLAESLDHIESFVMQSPEARYRQLVADNPDLINRVPGKYIASMLGITPVSLSRIRKRMYKREKAK